MSNISKKHKGMSPQGSNEQMTTQPNQESPPWTELPETFIIEIFQCLGDKDRVSMSMVTTKWYQVFCSPRLWRKRKIEFIDAIVSANKPSCMLSNGKCAIKYLQRFGSHLRDVEISIHRNLENEFSHEFNCLSEALEASSLKKIKINVLMEFIPTDEEHVIRILQNQKTLVEFDAICCWFNLQSSHRLLKCLASNCARTLKHIFLPSMDQDPFFHMRGSVMEDLKRFTNISKLGIDMVLLSDDLLTFWSRQCPYLKLIEMWVTLQKVDYSGSLVSNAAWMALVKTHSKLLVKIYCQEDERESKLNFDILLPAVPLTAFLWDTYLRFRTELELITFLHRIANYHYTLRWIYLSFMVDFEDVNKALVMNILSQCKRLLPHKLVQSKCENGVWFIEKANRRSINLFD